MRNYSHNAPCPKCGEHDIYNKFRAKGERLDDCIGDPFDEAEEDVIRRYCRNCGWQWSERPLNQLFLMLNS